MKFFEQFPTVQYDQMTARNILKKVVISDIVKTEAMAFLPYTIVDGDTPWQIADMYYGSADRVWLVYMSNDIVDPIYDWYLDTRQFEDFLKKKYGSIALAQSTILHYKDINNQLRSKDTYTFYSGSQDKTQWTKVYAYDYEDDLNEAKRHIMLLDSRYAQQAERNLKSILKDG